VQDPQESAVVDIGDFRREVLERSHTIPVMVDFWAEWCGPCKILGPVLERLAGAAAGRWVLAKVDTERHPEVAQQYGVRSIPNVKLFVDGKVTHEFTGALPEQTVLQWLEKALPNEHRKDVERGRQLIGEGRIAEAQDLLGRVLKADPANEDARVGLAGTYIQNDSQKALDLIRNIEEHSPHYHVVEAIRIFASVADKVEHPDRLPDAAVKDRYLGALRALGNHDYASALKGFIDVLREDRYYDDDGSRRACVAIFNILGDDHETTRAYRRSFSSALY
jgi:putative thioredoxin